MLFVPKNNLEGVACPIGSNFIAVINNLRALNSTVSAQLRSVVNLLPGGTGSPQGSVTVTKCRDSVVFMGLIEASPILRPSWVSTNGK